MNQEPKSYVAHVRDDKRVQSLAEHLTGVGEKAGLFSAKIGLAKQGLLLGLLHDLGKYSDAFQSYLKSATELLNQDDDEDHVDASGLRGKIDHSTAGAQILWREMAKHGRVGQIVGQMLALCVASHHSGLIDCLSSDRNSVGDDNFSRRINKADDRSHLTEAWAKVDAPVRERIATLLADEVLVAEVREVLARIAGATPAKDDRSVVAQQQIGLLVRFLFSCLVDGDRLDTAHFERSGHERHRRQGTYTAWTVLSARLEKHLGTMASDGAIDHLRKEISRHCLDAAARARGLYTLTVPTGGGKTLASLRFALNHARVHRMDRIIYVIPYTSIIDQNATVVRNILEPEGIDGNTVVLEHHASLTPETQGWRDKMLTENWDAPVIYTTMVQLLETLFGGGTRGARRMHQMANAVLIFDEVQSLPVNCVHLFSNAINFLVDHCRSTAVMCTATQPLLDKVDPMRGAIRLRQDSELMRNTDELFVALKRVEVIDRQKDGGWSENEIADLAAGEVGLSGSCLVITNTKKAARTLYQRLKQLPGVAVFHLSTSLCPAHRKENLSRIREHLSVAPRKPVLCISTQLIEAGVDVDFGSVVRYVAGLDSIAQAAGRCNRNRLRETGRVHVVNPAGEDLGRLTDIHIGAEKAKRVLSNYRDDPTRFAHSLLSPQALNWYYENYFFARAGDMSYPVSSDKLGHDDTLLNLLSVNSISCEEHGRSHAKKPDIYLRQSYMAAAKAFAAINAPTQGIVVPWGAAGHAVIADLCSVSDIERRYDLLRRAQQFTVNVFPHELTRLQDTGAVRPVQAGTQVLYLDSRFYCNEVGLVTEPVDIMEALAT